MRGKHYIESQDELDSCINELRNLNLPEHGIVIELKYGKRTTKQNNALHLFCSQLAETLNAAGLDQRKVLKPDIEIPWSLNSVKKKLWGSIMQALTGKEHTSDLDRDEIDKVYMALSRHMGEKFGVLVEFPSKDRL